MDIKELQMLNDLAAHGLKPDLTIILDLAPEIGLARANARNKELNLTIKEGRFEAEALEFHQKIRAGFLALSKQEDRFFVVNAEQNAEAVFADVCKKLQSFL